MYTVYGTVATRTFRVLWMLEEVGAAYTHEAAAPQSEQIRTLSSLGKIPVLTVDGTALTDSVAILTFLADRHGALTFPAGTLDRARQDGLTHQVVDELDALLWTSARHSFILPEERRVPAIRDSLIWEFERNLERLDARLAGPFLMGEEMTIADIVACHCLGWATVAKFPLGSERLQEYVRRLRARDAYARARSHA